MIVIRTASACGATSIEIGALNEQERNVVQPAHAFAESGEDIESGHLRHVYVAQDEIRMTRELSDSFDTIRGDNSLESLILQNLDQQVDGCGVILNA